MQNIDLYNVKLNEIVIKEGKVFVEGRQSVSPNEIGYALLDYVRDHPELTIKIVN